MKSKLLKTERYIRIYPSAWGGYIDEYLLDINEEELISLIPSPVDDPLLYDGVILDANQITILKRFLKKEILTDFEKYHYVLEADGIYEDKSS